MPPKSKRHVCGHCQESFTSKMKLQTHMQTHDDADKCDLNVSISELESSSSLMKNSMMDPINNVQIVEAMRSNLMPNLPPPLTGLPSPIATVQSTLLPNAISLPSPMNLPRLPSPINFTKSLLLNKTSNVSQKNEVKNENDALKFREYKCNKCDKSFTTAGSHKRHQSGCKATAKIVPVEEEIDSEDMDDDDIDSVPSSSDDEMNFASSSFEGNSRSKMTGNISRRVNSLLKEKKAKMVTCKVCKSKYNKDFGECQKCKIKELKKKTEPKKTAKQKNTPKSAPSITLPPPIASTLPPPIQLQTEEVCISCGEICPNKQSLASHQITCDAFLKDKEDKEKENFNDEDNFSTPEKNDGEGTEECATCGAKFHNKVALLEHLASHTGPLDKALMCGICQKTFSRKYHLDRHLLMTACSGQPPPSHTCQVCGKAYTRKDNLREHLRAHAGEVLRRKKYKCDFCDKHFHGTSLLKIHERTHTGERPFKCDFCSKAFPSTGALTKHRRIHTGEKPYACVDCGVSFSLKGTLNRHMRIHTGVRPHKCEYCGKEFIQAGGLKAHLFFHTGQNGFKCQDCGKLFNRKARLQMHIRYVHEKLKPFECSDCGKAFTRREDLYRHSVLHSGEKPHQCPTCQKRFAIKPSLKLHMLTHTKEEPRSCHECGRAFIRKDCLLRHMRKRHRELLNKILLDEKEASTHNPDSPGTSRILTEQNICDSIRELLSLLVDESTLKGFGWPDKPVDELLESVIKRCGHTPVNPEDYSYMDRLRENSKLLFTVVIDDNAVKTLLNNQTVDEVILHVLRLAKS